MVEGAIAAIVVAFVVLPTFGKAVGIGKPPIKPASLAALFFVAFLLGMM